MTTVEVVLQRSFTQFLFSLLLFGFCLFVICYLLYAVLFYCALILWGIAFVGMLFSYLFSSKLYAITLIETAHTRKINLRYGAQWYNDVAIHRSIMIAGTLYLECKITNHKRLKLWLFRDRFKTIEARYQLMKFLVLNVDK